MSGSFEAALSYANRKWQVLPCHHIVDGRCSCGNQGCNSPGMHPRTQHGHKDATTDPEKIRAWWEQVPEANIGIRTGAESGIWVLDVDGPEGIEALTKLEAENTKLPETPTASTGGGGRHLFFSWPSDIEIKSRAKISGLRIDTRGSGGYVVAPPSNHASGNVYAWQRSPEDAPLAHAPEWLLDFVSSKTPATVAMEPDASLFPEKL